MTADGGGGGHHAAAGAAAADLVQGGALDTPDICTTGVLLRLPDAEVEREYWQEHAACGGLANDVAGCLLGIYFPAIYLRGYLSAPDAFREHGSLARFCAPTILFIAACLAQLSLMALAPRAYRRHRFTIHLAMRTLRLAHHVLGTLLTADVPLYWRLTLLAHGSEARRPMATALYVLPLTFLINSLTNPCPVARQPLLAAVTVVVYARGWLPTCAWVFGHPKVAPAAQALCSRLELARMAASSAGLATLGWLSPGKAATSDLPLPSTDGCACALQKVSMAVMLLAAIVLPNAIGWWAELRSKSHFLLKTRRLRLRVCALSGARARLEAAGIWPGASALAVAAPSLAAAAALLLWQLSDGLVAALGPGC